MRSVLLALFCAAAPAWSQTAPARWRLEPDGPRLVWDVAADPHLPHEDQLEMSGARVSLVVRYGVDAEGGLVLRRTVVWPGFRTIPNDTHASLMRSFDLSGPAGGGEWRITLDGAPAPRERPRRVVFDGLLAIESTLGDDWTLTRTLFPSPSGPWVVERLALRNDGERPRRAEVAAINGGESTDPKHGVDGAYNILNAGERRPATELAPGAELRWSRTWAARKVFEPPPPVDAETEEWDRRALVERLLRGRLVLQTPEPELDAAFAFAKLRAAESVFDTRGGPLHAPGGTRYYAAIWANDSVEYVGPFFPLLGDARANQATWNALRHFARFMNDEFRPLPSSIIAEGRDVWAGAGDRGDAAMIAYGGARFLLALGDRAAAEEQWPLIEWCLEYCRRRTTAGGVVASDSDELEGRLPHGRTNLSTSTLAYGGLVAAARLARSLGGRDELAAAYEARAAELAAAIECVFGAELDGHRTYRYHEGGEALRSWICLPLTVGLHERAAGTLDALFSPRMWTPDGLRSIATDTSFWDRSTLSGLRGAFAAGDTERALAHLRAYTQQRLLGEHVPYAVEAWPEGDRRHLAAESALYARVFTEGLFGIEPLALDAFRCTPRLPAGWPAMALSGARAFGADWDLVVERADGGVRVTLYFADGVSLTRELGAGGATEFQVPAAQRRDQATQRREVAPEPPAWRDL